MTDYLVFNTEAEATAIESAIFNFGKQLASVRGYTVDAEGIVGNRNEQPDTSSAKTTAWSDIRQRVDGKWVVLHPKYHPAANDPALLSQLTSALGLVVSEVEVDSWWPDVVLGELDD